MKEQVFTRQNIQEIYPTHPFFQDKVESNRNDDLKDLRSCVDDYIQVMHFWQYSIGISNSSSTEVLSFDSTENNAHFVKEYLLSLLDISEISQNKNIFFPEELLLNFLTVSKKKESFPKKAFVRKSDNSFKKSSNSEEDNLLLENSGGNNDEMEIAEDDESELDFEYMNSELNEDYDELEDNSNDYDVI